MNFDAERLAIPYTGYDTRVTMPCAEFPRIMRDVSQRGESVRIEVSKEGVRFASEGEAANGSVLLKNTAGAITGGRLVVAPTGSARNEDDEDRVKK